MTDGKAQRPEESAQREARSEPIPTPEGQGGGEREEAMALAARIVEEYTMYDFGMSPANELTLARALLSSPRVEEVRREALEEAAKVAETRHVHWHMPHPDDAFPGEVKCDVTACADIAKAIRALSLQVG